MFKQSSRKLEMCSTKVRLICTYLKYMYVYTKKTQANHKINKLCWFIKLFNAKHCKLIHWSENGSLFIEDKM